LGNLVVLAGVFGVRDKLHIKTFIGISSFQILAKFRRGLFYSYLATYLRHSVSKITDDATEKVLCYKIDAFPVKSL
jgi:hypothetical protein